MKKVKINIPTKEDIIPTAKSTVSAIVEVAHCVPTLILTLATGGISLFKHSVVEGGKLLKSGGISLAKTYKTQRFKRALTIINKQMDQELSNPPPEAETN